jgi:hypothetical protein
VRGYLSAIVARVHFRGITAACVSITGEIIMSPTETGQAAVAKAFCAPGAQW